MPRYPTGSGRGGGSARDGAGRFAGRELVLSADDRHPHPPRAPSWLSARGKRRYRELWATPISVTWQAWHRDTVARLAELGAQIEEGGRATSLFAACTAAETALGLTPKAQAGRRIRIVAAEEPGGNGVVAEEAGLAELAGDVEAFERSRGRR